jgi:uncharacterized protein
MNKPARLSAKERDELESLMERRNPEGPLGDSAPGLHGFFTSVVSGPLIMPSEWMILVFGSTEDNAWEDDRLADRTIDLAMRFYNEVCLDLVDSDRQFRIMIDRIGEPSDYLDLADAWCKGYLIGISLRPDAWNEPIDDPEVAHWFEPIVAIAATDDEGVDAAKDPKKYAEMLALVPECAVQIYQWWRRKLYTSAQPNSIHVHYETIRRSTPKISPNDPCPCGSGKKYKRCCSPLNTVR